MTEKLIKSPYRGNIKYSQPKKFKSSNSPLRITSIKSKDEQAKKMTKLDMLKVTIIIDGIYISNKYIINNSFFMNTFKITHIINVSGEKFSCNLKDLSFQLINISWEDSPEQELFDPEFIIPNEIENFIDDSIKTGEGLLIYSKNGTNRACIIIIIYFMKKYDWSLQKSMEYLKIKKPDMFIPHYFISQLKNYEEKLNNSENSFNWFGAVYKDQNEEIISKTFVNCFLIKYLPVKIENNIKKNKHVNWDKNDNNLDNSSLKRIFKKITSYKKIKPKKSCIKKNIENRYTDSINIVNKNNPNKKNNNFSITKHENKSSNNNKKNENLLVNGDFKKKKNDVENKKLQVVNQISFSFDIDNEKLLEDNGSSKNNDEILKIRKINKCNKILSIKKQPMDYNEVSKMIKSYISNINNKAPKNNIKNKNKTLQICNINFNIIPNINNNNINNINKDNSINSSNINTDINNSITNKESISINNCQNNNQKQNIIFNNTFINNNELNNNKTKNNYIKYHHRNFLSNNNNSIPNYENGYHNFNRIGENINNTFIKVPKINMYPNFQKNENIDNDSLYNLNINSCINTPRTNNNNYINLPSFFEPSNDNIENDQKNEDFSEREIDENTYNEIIQGNFEYNEKRSIESYKEKNRNNNKYYSSNNIIINDQNNEHKIIENSNSYNITNFDKINYNIANYIKTNKIPNYNNNSQILQSPKINNGSKIYESRSEIMMPIQKLTSSPQLETKKLFQLPQFTNLNKPVTFYFSSIQQKIKENVNKKIERMSRIAKLKDIKNISFPDFKINKKMEAPQKKIRYSIQIPELIQMQKMSTMTQTPIQTNIFPIQQINETDSVISKTLKPIEIPHYFKITPIPKNKNRTKKIIKSPNIEKPSTSFEISKIDYPLSEINKANEFNNPINIEIQKMYQPVKISQINKIMETPKIPQISENTQLQQIPQISEKIPIINFNAKNEVSQIFQSIPASQTNQFTNTSQIIPKIQTNKITTKIYPILE